MNEHSSGTRATVPPSATDSGTQEETPDKALAEFKRLVLVAADHLADRLGHELAQGNAAKVRFLKALKQRDAFEKERDALWRCCDHSGIDPTEFLKDAQVAPEMNSEANGINERSIGALGQQGNGAQQSPTTEGSARENASDAGGGINPDCVADQGSVRNATDADPVTELIKERDDWT